MEVAINNLQVTLVDHWVVEYNGRGLKRIEDRWMVKMGTLFVGVNTKNEVLNNKLWGSPKKQTFWSFFNS